MSSITAPLAARARVRQAGAVLIVSLVFLLVMTVLGVTGLRTVNLQERMAGNLRDNNLAFQAAEAALRDGEDFLEQAALPQFAGTDGLLQRQTDSGRPGFWNSYDWENNSRPAQSLNGEDAVRELPRYVIEELPPVPAQGDSLRFGALPDVGFYRITAWGEGGTEEAVSIVQSTYRR